jgi:heat shock protein HslJ
MRITLRHVYVLPFVIAAALTVSCKSAPDTPSGANGPAPEENVVSAPRFGDITGKEWKLIGAWSSVGAAVSFFSRQELEDVGMENAYTLRFDRERLSGMGALNRYSAPYTQSAEQTLSVRAIAATLMASIREPEHLKELEYFEYLRNAVKWDLILGQQLQLISLNERGEITILVFETW